jgi:DNA-binding transcriptional ArsR family regulator
MIISVIIRANRTNPTMTDNTTTTPQLRWDWGTAYDLFASLFAVHHPARFGIRAAWAAGVRSRIPAEPREVIGETIGFLGLPVHWILDQSGKKDARTVLSSLERVPRDQVLQRLALNPRFAEKGEAALLNILSRKRVTDEDCRTVAHCHRERTDARVSEEQVHAWLSWWTRPSEFGEVFVSGLRAYYDNFFQEEEGRIRESLESSIGRAKSLSKTVPFVELLEDLTQGVKIESFLQQDEVILIPSFWTTPLILYGEYRPGSTMIVYGARPRDASLVPGDVVPDSLSRALSALSDNTRLRIIKLLHQSPRTQVQIARELRLRAPTITHHLKTLRLAGLIRLTVTTDGEKRYSTRMSRVRETMRSLADFVGEPSP